MPKAPASSTRSTRSRYSSPHPKQTPNGESSSQSKAGTPTPAPADTQLARQQSMLRGWLEPPLNSKPSFQDEGLVRHGVVENMAPLGTMPKAGLFKKTSGPVLPPPEPRLQPIRKIVFKNRPKPAAPPTPAPIDTPAAVPAPEEDETEEEEEEEEDPLPYDQDGRRYSLQSGEGMEYSGYSRRSMSGASGQMGSISSSTYQHAPMSLAELKDRTDQVIEKAVDEALNSFRYPTAFALRTLYDEKCHEPAFLGMIDRVFRQVAHRDDLNEFRQLMAPKKREGRQGNKACYYFIPPSTGAGFPPHVPKPAPYGHLIKIDLSIMRKEPTPERQSESDLSAQQHTTQPEPTPERTPTPQPETKAEPEPSPAPVVSPSPAPPPAPAVAPSPAPEPVSEPAHEPAAERVGKRELPQEEEQQEQEQNADAHVRKKRRSNRHSTAAAKMSVGAANGKVKVKSPEKRRTRHQSHSSTSSLSSARSLSPPAEIENDAEGAEVANETGEVMEIDEPNDAAPSRASPAAESVSSVVAPSKSAAKKKRRSIVVRKSTKASAASEQSASKASTPAVTRRSAATSQETTPAPQQAADELANEQHYDMPAVVDSPLFPQQGKKGTKGGLVFPSKVGKIDDNDPKLRLRQSARAISNIYQDVVTESFARDVAAEDDATPEVAETAAPAASSSRSRASLPATRSTPAATNTRSTRSARKRSHDEVEEQPSPIVANFPIPDAVSSTPANSRAGTPSLRAAKKPRTGLRVKNSPVKKKSGTSAGIPRASGERSSPGAAPREAQDDNDDYCASCGGNGELLCCDGCTRSFHFHCVDPVVPKNIDTSENAEWFCNVCLATRETDIPVHKGPFALLLERLDGKNSTAFRLPHDVRDRFEGVRTGPDGEYEEITAVVKPTRKKKNDEETIHDLFRLRDAEGNPVICHGCQKSSCSNRAIIPCGLCGLHWHLDCLDPPLANPPVLRTWKCPCHIEDVLAKVPGNLGPAHRFRKIKGAPIIEPIFQRGYINNGYIEVADDETPDESGWKDVETYGRIVRLPQKGIKLDFVSRMRQNRKGKPIPPAAATPAAESRAPPMLDKRELDKQQAAYNLVQLSGQGTSGVDALVDALIAEANPAVIDLMARSNADRIAENQGWGGMEEQSLRAMLAQVDRMGDRIRHLLNSATPATQGPASGVANLTHAQTATASSEGALVDQGKEKNLPSPALSRVDEEKALTPLRDGEDALVGSSPTDGKSVADKDDMPATPTDNRLANDDDGVIVKEPKTAVEIEDGGMDLD
ncbi:hypothetical protein OQA88_150 [Cercophora sp. LCS_1]